MKHERRTKEWWRKLVAKWRRSGTPAPIFAEKAGVKETTLRWWAWTVDRDTRAVHGSTEMVPIEIAVPALAASNSPIEISIGDVAVRFAAGTDVSYVAALVRALSRP